MRETEVELEEKEVEVVYCDECGDDCTDDYMVEPKEVCTSCADGYSLYHTVEEMINDYMEMDEENDVTLNFFESVFTVVSWPIISTLMALSWFSDGAPSWHDYQYFLLISIGTAVWTAVLVLVWVSMVI